MTRKAKKRSRDKARRAVKPAPQSALLTRIAEEQSATDEAIIQAGIVIDESDAAQIRRQQRTADVIAGAKP